MFTYDRDEPLNKYIRRRKQKLKIFKRNFGKSEKKNVWRSFDWHGTARETTYFLFWSNHYICDRYTLGCVNVIRTFLSRIRSSSPSALSSADTRFCGHGPLSWDWMYLFRSLISFCSLEYQIGIDIYNQEIFKHQGKQTDIKYVLHNLKICSIQSES